MLVLFLSAAHAFDPDSLRSDATFGLFRDEYDYLREPATLSEQSGTHLFTVLGNQGGTNRFSLGALGPGGPGVLGIIGEIGLEGAASTTRTEVAATALDPATITEARTEDRVRDLAGFVGYGLPVGSSFAIGAGVSFADSRWRATLAPRPGSLPAVGGALQHVTSDGTEVLLQQGAWEQDARDAAVILGGALLGEGFDLEADVRLTRVSSRSWGRSVEVTDTTEYTFEGYLPNAGLEGNLAGTLPGLAVDLTADLADGVALRVFAEAERGTLAPVTTESFEGFDDETFPDARVTWDRYERLDAPDMRSQGAEALVAVHVDRDDVALRVGVAASAHAEDLVVTRIVEATSSATFDQTRVTETREAARQRYRGISLPIATEVSASDRFVVRAGGRWASAHLGFDGGSTLLGEPGEGDVTGAARTSGQTVSWIDLAVGFRWLAADGFSLDAAALGTGVQDERVAIDLTQLQLSGVFHF